MKNRLYGLLALLAGILLLGTGCSDDESGRTLLAAKTNLTLAKYCNAEDGLTSVVWKKGEQGLWSSKDPDGRNRSLPNRFFPARSVRFSFSTSRRRGTPWP